MVFYIDVQNSTFEEYLNITLKNSCLDVYTAHSFIYLHSVGYFFILLMISLVAQKLLVWHSLAFLFFYFYCFLGIKFKNFISKIDVREFSSYVLEVLWFQVLY